MTVPGVGPRTAEAMAAWIDRPARFASNKRIGSYFGLVPCQDTSAGKERLGHITQQGPSLVRALLTEASWQAIRRSPEVRRYFERAQRGDPKKTNRPDCHRSLLGQSDLGQRDQRPSVQSRFGGMMRDSKS